MTVGSPKDASSSGVLMESGGWNKDHTQSLQQFGQKRNKPYTLVKAGSGLMLTPFLWTDGSWVVEQQNALPTRCE